MSPFTVRLTFHGDLAFFLKHKAGRTIERHLGERTSVKDVIESSGVPHPEVDLILVNGQPVDFAAILTQDVEVDVYPPNETRSPLFPENRLQVRHIEKFVADGHLGKLVRDLRLLGIDVAYDRDAEDRQLLNAAQADNRAILTRDRRLLMHSSVRHGYYLRSQNPLEQTVEALRRFDLFSMLTPFTRCLHCNASLKQVAKTEVFEQLEPLTKIYYEQFRRCTGCGQIYWSGSHFEKLEARIAEIRQRL
ncbi:MAG TPA: Mut7-C RNAse domain-containing protein [Chthoniobacterales bacterium]|nr:Mut7-C RNAse domain-containing protein [Chthoniobacterales bacterium]